MLRSRAIGRGRSAAKARWTKSQYGECSGEQSPDRFPRGVRKVTARFGEVIAITSYSGDCVENSMVNLNRETCHVEESHPHRCTVLRVGCRNGWRSYHPRAACFSKRTLHWVQLLIYQPNSGVLSPGPSAALVSITRKAARSGQPSGLLPN